MNIKNNIKKSENGNGKIEKVLFIASNFNIENKQNSHPIAIYNKYFFWWKRNNKTSTNYVCSNSSCHASIQLRGDEVLKSSGRHLHDEMTELEIQHLIAKQDLKKAITSDFSKSIANHYREMESNLVKSNIQPRIIAAKMPAYKSMSSGLQKRRMKEVPVIPKVFTKLEIAGKYALTLNGKQFLRYYNKSELNRIIMFADSQALKTLSNSVQWFMDGTFKSAPIQLLQLFTIHALVKTQTNSTTFPCVYVLTKKKKKNL